MSGGGRVVQAGPPTSAFGAMPLPTCTSPRSRRCRQRPPRRSLTLCLVFAWYGRQIVREQAGRTRKRPRSVSGAGPSRVSAAGRWPGAAVPLRPPKGAEPRRRPAGNAPDRSSDPQIKSPTTRQTIEAEQSVRPTRRCLASKPTGGPSGAAGGRRRAPFPAPAAGPMRSSRRRAARPFGRGRRGRATDADHP